MTPAQDRVAAALERHPLAAKEIAEKAGLKLDAVQYALDALRRRGRAQRVGGGKRSRWIAIDCVAIVVVSKARQLSLSQRRQTQTPVRRPRYNPLDRDLAAVALFEALKPAAGTDKLVAACRFFAEARIYVAGAE